MLYLLDRHAPDDALAHTILDEVGSEPDQREIRIWLSYLARTSYDSVAQRLLRAGRVAPERSRRGLRQTVVYVPVDGVAAAGTWARLSTALRRREPMTEEDVFLAGLAAVTGLQGHIVPDPTDGSLDHLRRGVRDMSTGLRELLLHTEAAVGAAAMTHRT